jgi:hypothetical protein
MEWQKCMNLHCGGGPQHLQPQGPACLSAALMTSQARGAAVEVAKTAVGPTCVSLRVC